MRTIKFKLLTQTNLESLTTNAVNFGELKQELKQIDWGRNINFNSVQFIERTTKVAYGNVDEAILPAVDSIFIVVPTQTKSGRIVDLDSMTYNGLRTYVSKLNRDQKAGIDMSGSKEAILVRVKAYLNKSTVNDVPQTSQSAQEECVCRPATANELGRGIKNMVDALVNMAETPKVVEPELNPKDELVVSVTVGDLDEEAKKLAKCFR